MPLDKNGVFATLGRKRDSSLPSFFAPYAGTAYAKAHLQFLARPGRPPPARLGRGPTRPAGPARRGHFHPGNLPPLQAVLADHRADGSQPPHAAGDPRELPRPLSSGGGAPAVRHGPAELFAQLGQVGRLRRHRHLVEEGRRRGQDPGDRADGVGRQGDQLRPHAAAGRLEARSGGRLRLHDLERDDPRRAVRRRARLRRRAPGLRFVQRLSLPAGAYRPLRHPLRLRRRTPVRRA